MSTYETILVSVDPRGVARLTLHRPESKNAMSQPLLRELQSAAKQLEADPAVRVIVLSGTGEVFSAGGDLKGFQQQATGSRDGRLADATEFAQVLSDLNNLAKPLFGRINGSAFGGGLGLISVCDLAIGLADATFRLTEVTLGLIPAVISPYVVARIGVPNSRRTMLNAHKLDGRAAVGIGLLDEALASIEELDHAIEREVSAALACAPGAVAKAKQLIRYVSTHDAAENSAYTAKALADAWETDEIREGVAAFMGKRKPNWQV